MLNNKVLLVEDNKKLNEINRRALENAGYATYAAFTLAEAREHVSQLSPEVILLDVAMPDGCGFDFCAEIREATDAHILFLTSRREHDEKLRGLQLGGDDYITKPYKLSEMLARVAAAVRRRGMDKSLLNTIEMDSLTLNVCTSTAFIDGKDLALSQKEFCVLLCLVQNAGNILDAETLFENAWNQPMNGDKSALQITISRLRKKIKPSGYGIDCIRGNGYALEHEARFDRKISSPDPCHATAVHKIIS